MDEEDSFDFYETHIEDREDVEEREYRSVDIRRYIWKGREGDIVTVEAWGSSYKDRTLRILGRRAGELFAEDTTSGKKFILLPAYWGGKHGNIGDGNPWLRTKDGYDSAGEIRSITIERLES